MMHVMFDNIPTCAEHGQIRQAPRPCGHQHDPLGSAADLPLVADFLPATKRAPGMASRRAKGTPPEIVDSLTRQ